LRVLVLVVFAVMGCQTPVAVGTAAPALIPTVAPETASPPGPGASVFAYEIGAPVLTDLYVSPAGNDANDGLSASAPLRTLTAAWEKIPGGGALTGTGYRINLLPGVYSCEPAEPDDCRNYFADRRGTSEFPILLRAASGPGSVTLRGGMNVNNVSYLYLLDFTLVGGNPLPIAAENDLLHLASVDHVLLRQMTLDGPDCANDVCNNLQEVLKVNQAQYIYVEDSEIGGAWHSAVDYVSVQYGHFLGNHVHTAGEWCMYVKGGSAYQQIEGNEFEGCQLGFQAGQSTNMAVMRSPWVHYEAYDIKFVNNLMHDLPGVSLSVMGGYNILFAYNTLYHVGYDDDPGYALLQAVHGERGCNPTTEIPDPVSVCSDLIGQGGWGPGYETSNLAAIPNRNVYIYNNLIYNPDAAHTLWAHLNIYGPIALPAGFQNLPSNPVTDDHLVIAGNLIWDGPSDHPLGVDNDTGCADSNPTCNTAQLLADNTINLFEPQLVNPSGGDYHPVAGGNVFDVASHPLPNFTWDSFSPVVPSGNLSNVVPLDYNGMARPAGGPPGACVNAASSPLSLIYLPLLSRFPQ
jgi:hypothetical protein